MAIRRRSKGLSTEPISSSIEEAPIQEPIKTEQKEPETLGSKNVKVEVDKKVDEEVMIDFMGEGFSNEFASRKTKESDDGTLKSNIPLDAKVGDLKNDINNSENKRDGSQFTFKDILQIATFLINAFDGGIGILLNYIARDNRVSVYTLPAETKRQLSEQLALVLIKYQVKFKIEFLFLMTLIIAYIGPVGGALKHRKQAQEGNPPRVRKGGQVKAKVETKEESAEPSEDAPEQKTEEASKEEFSPNRIPREKKKRGRPKATL